MNIILIGMNHRTAPLEIRERLSISCEENSTPLPEILKIRALREALYLSTCNRVEVLARVADPGEAAEGLRDFIFSRGNLSKAEMERCLYIYRDDEAVRHIFRVASSLDSMVMGEPQILGQVKDAYRQCVEHRASGIILNKLLHHAFRVAKRVRTETGIANNAVSVSFAAVELAKKIFGTLQGKTTLLIGAGEMSELAARHLVSQGIQKIIVANRTYERAVALAGHFHGIPAGFDRLGERLQEADIVIGSTGAPGYVVTKEMAATALHRRKNRLMFFIDIAVPRDIDPAVSEIDNVYLYNIDDLQQTVDENLRERMKEAQKAEDLIGEEVLKFAAWHNTLEAVPTIRALKEKVEGIMQGELERAPAWMKNLGDEDRKEIEILLSSVLNKVLHDPITGLKEETQEDGAIAYIAAIRRLFKLENED
jgi:glutamyl-tRNA reductase